MAECAEERSTAFTGRLDARDAWLALAVALAAGLLYALTQQTRYYGDGPGLVSLHVLGGGERYYNVLYLPACDLVQRLLFLEPLAAPRVLSSLAAAVGLGLGYLNLRRTGAERPGALRATALLACASSLWFYATTPEVHTLHFALVQLVAFVTLSAPWGRPALALGLVACVFPLLYGSHVASVTLGPGWVLLVQLARTRAHAPFRWRTLLFVIGPVLLAALVLAMVGACWLRFGNLASFFETQLGQVELHDVAGEAGVRTQQTVWRDEWLVPLGVLVPLALAGFFGLRRRAWLLPATAALVFVPFGFFLWWDVYERGGYFLGSAPFLMIPVAHLLGRLRGPWRIAFVPLLGLQVAFAGQAILEYDRGWDPAERVAMVREALGESGLLVASVPYAPDIRCTLPRVEEVRLADLIRRAYRLKDDILPPSETAARVWPMLRRILAHADRAAIEIGYTVAAGDQNAIASMVPAMRELEALVRTNYSVRELPHPYWPMLVIELPPRDASSPMEAGDEAAR